MGTRINSTIFLLVFSLLLVSCSDDPREPAPTTGLLTGEVDPAGPGFTLVLETAGSATQPLQGPFVLTGENVRWLPGLGAIAIDLQITNAGEETHPEPVGLTFVDLMPDSVQVLDPDNGIEGPGAAIVFEFANRDVHWTPGETSLPRTVTFLAYDNEAVAFTARVDVGQGPLSGAIGGLVWEDLDADGAQSPDEPGLAGIRVGLERPSPPLFGGGGDPLPALSTLTGDDGRYLFTDLWAGLYAVRVDAPPGSFLTTDVPLQVVLAEVDGRVSQFLAADFGITEPLHIRYEMPAAADATVRADLAARTNDNYGCAPYLAVGTGRGGESDRIRGLVRFVLPDYPDVELPDRVLFMMQIDRYRDGTDQMYSLAVHPVIESDERTPWIEGDGSDLADGSSCLWVDEAEGVAWYGAGDGGDDNNQSQPDFAPEPAWLSVLPQSHHGSGAVVGWNVTGLVRAWLTGDLPNHGLVVRDIGAPPGGGPATFRSLWFVSREGEERGEGRYGPRLGFIYDEDQAD